MILKPFVPGFLLAVVISSHSSSFLNQPQNLSLNTSQTELFFMSNIGVIFFSLRFPIKKTTKKTVYNAIMWSLLLVNYYLRPGLLDSFCGRDHEDWQKCQIFYFAMLLCVVVTYLGLRLLGIFLAGATSWQPSQRHFSHVTILVQASQEKKKKRENQE